MGAPLWRWGGYHKKNEEMTRLLFGSLKKNGRFARGDRTVGLHCITKGCTGKTRTRMSVSLPELTKRTHAPLVRVHRMVELKPNN